MTCYPWASLFQTLSGDNEKSICSDKEVCRYLIWLFDSFSPHSAIDLVCACPYKTDPEPADTPSTLLRAPPTYPSLGLRTALAESTAAHPPRTSQIGSCKRVP